MTEALAAVGIVANIIQIVDFGSRVLKARWKRAAPRSSRWPSGAPNIGQNANEPSLLDALPPSRFTYLPNTAGCYSADDAVRTLRLARELLDGHDLVKLEVLGDPNTLYPNVIETLKAAQTLVQDGFKVMVYTSDDPIVAKQLEDIGCVAVMPLASLIGSGMGILNPGICSSSSRTPRCRSSSMPAWAPLRMPPSRWSSLRRGSHEHRGRQGAEPRPHGAAMKKAVEAGREAFLAAACPRSSTRPPRAPRPQA